MIHVVEPWDTKIWPGMEFSCRHWWANFRCFRWRLKLCNRNAVISIYGIWKRVKLVRFPRTFVQENVVFQTNPLQYIVHRFGGAGGPGSRHPSILWTKMTRMAHFLCGLRGSGKEAAVLTVCLCIVRYKQGNSNPWLLFDCFSSFFAFSAKTIASDSLCQNSAWHILVRGFWGVVGMWYAPNFQTGVSLFKKMAKTQTNSF